MMTSAWLFVAMVHFSPAQAGDNAPTPPAEPNPHTDPPSTIRAQAGPMKVTVPKGSHTVDDPMLNWTDLNVYPADNATVLQGAACGPVGDQPHAQIWLAGVYDYRVKDAPSHLEAVMVYAVECDDCPGEETTTARFDSTRNTPDTPAHLMGVDSMRIEDINNDGQFDVVLSARFRPGCTKSGCEPYSETLAFTAKGAQLVQVSVPEQ